VFGSDGKPVVTHVKMAKKVKKAVTYPTLRNLMTQSVMIVLCVLLALFLNEIREQQKVTADLKIAYKNIREEVESNRNALVSAGSIHRQNIAMFDSLLKKSGSIDLLEENFLEDLNLPDLQNAAWNTLHSNGLAEHLKYNDLYPLNKLYQLQKEGVENAKQELSKFVAQPDFFEKQRNAANAEMLLFLLNKLHSQEKRLLEETQMTLNNPGNWRYFE
jgi:hypothetical protein